MYRPNLSVVCFFICLSYFIFYCALLLFCAQAWHGKTLSSRINPIFFCSLHWRNLSSYNKITTTHFKQIRFWWKNVIKFRGKVYSNFFKFVQQLFFLSVPYFFSSPCHSNNLSVLWNWKCAFLNYLYTILFHTTAIDSDHALKNRIQTNIHISLEHSYMGYRYYDF